MAVSLHILVVETEAHTAAVIESALRRRGHEVSRVAGAEEALALEAPDVVVIDLELGDGMGGFDLLGRLRERGSAVRAVLVTELPTLEDYRRAMRLGAAELLAKPVRPEHLAQAVEAHDPASALPSTRSAWTFRRTVRAQTRPTERCVRELAAFLLRCGLGPTIRARVATACGEVLDNAVQHAYLEVSGGVSLEAELGERDLVVCIHDEGVGCDPLAAAAGPHRDTTEGGLARAGALAEDLRLESTPGGGTRVELRFVTSRVTFDEDDFVDLSELDWFSPGTARRVLETLRSERTDALFDLSPALAVTVGRLLSAPTAEQSVQKALWS